MTKIKRLKGQFCGPRVQGLTYSTQTQNGITNMGSEFSYLPGETITFSIGDLILGSCVAREMLTPCNLVIEVEGDDRKLTNRAVINLAVFLQSLNPESDPDNIIVLTSEITDIVNTYRYKINFSEGSSKFSAKQDFINMVNELGAKLRSIPSARNTLRRGMHGIRKMCDIHIPLRDGSYLSADIYRPVKDGKYPVITSSGAFGKNFLIGRLDEESDYEDYEMLEDAYFQGNISQDLQLLKMKMISRIFGKNPPVPHNAVELPPESDELPDFETFPFTTLVNESFERPNVFDFVPKGYIVAHIDERGCGESPGYFAQFSKQNVDDYEDAIHWLGEMDSSNGNVGLMGASYYAMTQYTVASRQPEHLKAIIPLAGDTNSYRDYLYSGGGIFDRGENFEIHNAKKWNGLVWIPEVLKNKFYSDEVYGPEGSLVVSAIPEKLNLPMWIACPIGQTIHTNGSSRAYTDSPSKQKKFLLTSEPGIHFWMYNKEFTNEFIKFFDHFLKEEDNDVMEGYPVKIMVLTGWGSYYWLTASDWPLPETDYVKMYLDAEVADYADGNRSDQYYKLGFNLEKTKSVTYNADVKCAPQPLPDTGVCFLTEPFEKDMVVVGHPKFGGWVSSTSIDMELHISIRLYDENGKEVEVSIHNSNYSRKPVALGSLKVSHRVLDADKSTIDRPHYLHTKEAYAPLTPGEVVNCQVKMMPTAFKIKKGWRMRLNVDPMNYAYCDYDDAEYRAGSRNTLHTGKNCPSFIQLPAIE